MKMVKSLLLGSAAGLVAVAGAQAADLPVKAKPVQYVKICSLYGVGFYYIPGTDMCIKIGGWVRAEYGWGQNGNFAWGWASNNVNNRSTNNSDFRARGYITADARNQTEYGTVRGYIAIGLSENEHGGDVTASNNFSANRAFIQWAGFTFGRAQSFFDFYSNPATSYWGAFPGSDTGDGGWFVMGYTAQFGNGFSATIAAEAPRRTQIHSASSSPLASLLAGALRSALTLHVLTAASRYLTSSPTCASTRLGVLPRSWAPCMMSTCLTIGGFRHNPTTDHQRCPDDTKRAGRSAPAIKLNAPFYRPGRLLPGAVELHPGCSAVRLPDHPTPTGASMRAATLGFGPVIDGVYGGFVGGTAAAGILPRPRTDHSMERQRGLRALLEPALAHVTVWRLCASQYGGAANNGSLCSGNGTIVVTDSQSLPASAATWTGIPAGSVRALSGTSQGLLHGSRRDVLRS